MRNFRNRVVSSLEYHVDSCGNVLDVVKDQAGLYMTCDPELDMKCSTIGHK